MIVTNDSSLLSCPPGYSLADHRYLAWTLVVINLVTSLVGMIGNLLVCIAVLTTHGMQASSFHYFISSLAAADLTVALVDQPLFVVLIIGRMSSECLSAVDFAFRLVGNFACAVSLLTLALIAIDRCLFLATKFNYKNTMTKVKKIVLAIVWGLACVYSAIRLTIDKEITSYLTSSVFGLCYVEMTVCYAVIYYQVFKQRKMLADSRLHNTRAHGAAHEIAAQTENNAIERRFARTVVMVLIGFTAGWFLLFYLRLTQPEKNYGIMYDTARTVALPTSAVNPALYCFNNNEYRRAFKRILLRFFFGAPQNRRRKYERIK